MPLLAASPDEFYDEYSDNPSYSKSYFSEDAWGEHDKWNEFDNWDDWIAMSGYRDAEL